MGMLEWGFGQRLRRLGAAVVACAALTLGCSPALAQSPSIAFAFEDGPRTHATALLSPQQRNAAMLKALADHDVKAVLFVTLNYGANEPAGLELARAWGDAGHSIGNHTVSHLDLDDRQVTLARYQQEVLECDAVISKLPGYKKWFRYTFLREGATQAQGERRADERAAAERGHGRGHGRCLR